MDPMLVKTVLCILPVCLCMGMATPMSGMEQKKMAWIEAVKEEKGCAITGFCKNETRRILRYQMTVLKSGGSGTSRSGQGGKVAPGGLEPVRLSFSRVGMMPGDTVSITLTVQDGETVIALDEKTLSFP